jgi:hypothetical protein
LKAIGDERLRRAKMDKESKLIIQEKMGGVEGTIAKIMEERNKNLDEKATGGASTLATTARKK